MFSIGDVEGNRAAPSVPQRATFVNEFRHLASMYEPKLVYRALRQISRWVVTNFYEDVQVQGGENVPKQAPVIIASSHHNEIIDIATLAITMPHGRHLSFWGKAALFKIPVLGWIMSSSGAIPVTRSPDRESSKTSDSGHSKIDSSQSSLFKATSIALQRGATVGCFVEGTSYTEPQIVQVKAGAAWAAIEYIRWIRQHNSRKDILTIVPVGIVYTDKTRYRSRVVVVYGQPIFVDPSDMRYLPAHASDDEARTAVKVLTKQIEDSLRDLTINAPDWGTLQAANTARAILYPDPARPLPLSMWVPMHQLLVKLFTERKNAPLRLQQARSALVSYSSLLLNAGFSLSHVTENVPSAAGLAIQTCSTFLHPVFLLWLPASIIHSPSYIFASVGKRVLMNHGEDETAAEIQGVIGGIGMGLSYAIVSSVLITFLLRTGKGAGTGLRLLDGVARALSEAGQVKGFIWSGVIIYTTGRFLNGWHNSLVSSNLTRLRQLLNSFSLYCGSFRSSQPLSQTQLGLYMVPPPRIVNPFIKAVVPEPSPPPPMIETKRLVNPVLEARSEAVRCIRGILTDEECEQSEELIRDLKRMLLST